MKLDDYRFVFIITYARSGSTLLQSLVNTAPGMQLRGENTNALLHIYRACSAIGKTAQRGRKDRTAAVDNPWFGASQVESQKICTRMLNMFLQHVLRPDPGIVVTGFKEIRHTPAQIAKDEEFHSYMDFILNRFPGARIVCNSRDADSVSQSSWLQKEDPERVRNWVARCDRRFQDLVARSDACLHMQYEDYTTSSAPIRHMFEFLDLTYDEDRIRAVLEKPLVHAGGGTKVK